jgi:probable F420-dependent oxidoreductase
MFKLDRGVAPGTTLSFSATRDLARATEAGGWDGLWVSEAKHDPFLSVAIAAEHTQSLTLGTSIAVAFARNPMTTAYTAYDLQRLSNGRFNLGLGSQVKPHIERRFNMPWSSPAARMRDFVLAMRAIWESWRTEEKLNYRGEFYQHTLMTPFFSPPVLECANPGVFIAAVGPAMTRVAGEVCDGVFLHGFTTPRFINEVSLPAINEGLSITKRPRDAFEIAMMSFIVTGETDEDTARAAQAVREQIGFYGSTPAYRTVMDLHGWGEVADELNVMSREGGSAWARLGEVITDEMLHEFAVVAPPDGVAQALVDRFDGVVDRLSFYVPYEASEELWDRIATDVRKIQATTA